MQCIEENVRYLQVLCMGWAGGTVWCRMLGWVSGFYELSSCVCWKVLRTIENEYRTLKLNGMSWVGSYVN